MVVTSKTETFPMGLLNTGLNWTALQETLVGHHSGPYNFFQNNIWANKHVSGLYERVRRDRKRTFSRKGL